MAFRRIEKNTKIAPRESSVSGSEVRIYSETADLVFFLYEVFLAQKYFAAHTRAKQYGVTADVMARSSQVSSGYYEVIRDGQADVCRVMLDRCFDPAWDPELYQVCRGMKEEVWMAAFP